MKSKFTLVDNIVSLLVVKLHIFLCFLEEMSRWKFDFKWLWFDSVMLYFTI